MHKTLERQLKRLKSKYPDPNLLLGEFVKMVNDTYFGFNKEQSLKDRAIHLMAEELEEVNRKNQEKNLAYISAILNSIVDGVITVSTSGLILDLNDPASDIIGKSIENLQDSKLTNLIQGYDDFQDLLSNLENGNGSRQTIFIENNKHKEIPCAISISCFDRFENPIYILILRDISDQQKAENKIKELNNDLRNHLQQLEISNKDLESFSFSISHDLRTPLGFIRNFVQRLQKGNAHLVDSKSERLLKMIEDHIQHMEHLIEDLLSFSRSTRTEPDKSKVDMNLLVSKILDGQCSSKNHHRIHIHELFPAFCDGSLIFQVFSNLISNALKYSSKVKEPVIEIGSKRNNSEILYFVTDNGAGFDESQSDKIFEPFQRMHSAEEFMGTGVGLSIAQRIVVRHGGRIWANGKKNVGASFFFTLPIHENGVRWQET